MEIDAKMAYEVAMQRLIQKEKELVELLALYNTVLQRLEELEREQKGE